MRSNSSRRRRIESTKAWRMSGRRLQPCTIHISNGGQAERDAHHCLASFVLVPTWNIWPEDEVYFIPAPLFTMLGPQYTETDDTAN
jgi:hypothetical protein